jgi:hypothetical protein
MAIILSQLARGVNLAISERLKEILSFLSNTSLFHPHSCNLFCFFSPLGSPADPAFIYAQLQLAPLHPVGLPFSLASDQFSYLPPLPMTSQHSVVLRVI